MPRTENAVCDVCNAKYYRRPYQSKESSNSYCSRKCFADARRKLKNCKSCNLEFNPKRSGQKFCSKECAIDGRKKRAKKGELVLTRTDGRLKALNEAFDFDSCMVDDCEYNRTYDVHRLIQGRNGGKYEIGNMFAICPNHHAEFHRGIITLEKTDNQTLTAIDVKEGC